MWLKPSLNLKSKLWLKSRENTVWLKLGKRVLLPATKRKCFQKYFLHRGLGSCPAIGTPTSDMFSPTKNALSRVTKTKAGVRAISAEIEDRALSAEIIRTHKRKNEPSSSRDSAFSHPVAVVLWTLGLPPYI